MSRQLPGQQGYPHGHYPGCGSLARLMSAVGEGQAAVVSIKESQQFVLQYLPGDTRYWLPSDQEIFDVL